MTLRVDVSRDLILWSKERSGVASDVLTRRFPSLEHWLNGSRQPTLKQLEKYALATNTPVGYFFLDTPPHESLPIPDFRTFAGPSPARPSTELLDTIHHCQQRQEWYRRFTLANGGPSVDGRQPLSIRTNPETAAASLTESLDFAPSSRGNSWAEALKLLAEAAEGQGILVMVNGVVGNNTHRRLDPNEFRGFALVDTIAPVVFVNGSDTKAAQMFTLAHELAHVLTGESGLDNPDPSAPVGRGIEKWCNDVAAEFLVPESDLTDVYERQSDVTDELDRLARRYRVSTLVTLRRLRDIGALDGLDYWSIYEAELARVMAIITKRSAGGNFYNTQPARVSKTFARAVIANTLEGQTLYRDAFQMLGIKKMSTFESLGEHLGVGR